LRIPGGFCKIGWPGIIVVEGPEEGCKAYVSALTRLRWKQIVVRGEERVPGSFGDNIDEMRLLPRGMREFGANAMSAMATACREHGCEALFLSAIKIKSAAPVHRKNISGVASIASGVAITPPGKSTFQAHVASIRSVAEAQAVIDHIARTGKTARATHNIWAYRFSFPPSASNGEKEKGTASWAHDNGDDGERGAGSCLAFLLEQAQVEGCVCVVSRWYGGVHLGPARFKYIKNVAREVLVQEGYIK